jgi:hypothetical protein
MGNTVGISFDGLDQIASELEKMDGKLLVAAEEALKATHAIITPKAQQAIARHRRTGHTEGSLWVSPYIERDGLAATVRVGFDIGSGGLPSVFLMWGTPRVSPDPAFFDAFHGQDEAIADAQRAAFERVLENG